MPGRICAFGTLIAAVSLISAPAMARETAKRFDIPSQDLGSALLAFGLQSGKQIGFEKDKLTGLRSKAVRDTLSSDQALRTMISGLPVSVRNEPGGLVIISFNARGRPLLAKTAPPPRPTRGIPTASESADISAAPGDVRGLEDIVVTAEKRETSLQKTPISISVLGAEALKAQGIASVADFQSGAVPSLQIIPYGGARPSAFVVGMRGVVPNDATQVTRDTSVGIYTDGVYLGRVQGLNTELVDPERIEILKGPQGTLFGRNAVAGAVSIISKKPTGEWGGVVTGGVRNFDGQNVAAHINLPAIANISVKFDGVYARRGGWVDNPNPRQADWGDYERWGVRGTALWRPTDSFSLQYAYDRSVDRSTVYYVQLDKLVPGATSSAIAPIFSLEPERVKTARGPFPLEPSVGKVYGHTLNANLAITDGIDLRSITAYRSLDQSQFDNDAGTYRGFSPNAVFGRFSFTDVHQKQFSQELQLVGSTDHVNYVIGAYYYWEKARESADTPFCCRFNSDGTGYTIFPEPLFGARPSRASRVRATSRALFAQATWTPDFLDERLHLTAGGRLTNDRKNGGMVAIQGVPSTLRFNFESTRLDPMATIAFDWTDTVNSYVKWGTAYRAGGANTRTFTLSPFNEEELETLEAGLKSELFDRRVRANLAVYKSIYRDIQIDVISPVNPALSETVNGTKPGKIWGIEADLTLMPIRGLTLNASYAFTHAKIAPQPSPFTAQIVNLKVAHTPKHAMSLSGDAALGKLGEASLNLHLDGNYASGTYSEPTDLRLNKGRTLINGRFSLDDTPVGGSFVSVGLWMKNITNEAYITYDFDYGDTLIPGYTNAAIAAYNEPRTYGVDVTFKF